MAAIKCPACADVLLAEFQLEPTLTAGACSQCRGVWIPAQHYWDWLQQQQQERQETPAAAAQKTAGQPLADTTPGRRCPECGHFMTHAKVGHGVSFHIDRCIACGGVWLNAGEWEALRAKGLHTKLHFVTSPAWQAANAREQLAAVHEHVIRKKLGDADFEQIRRIRKWIESHPHRAELYAYLHAADEGKR
jgi:Zn-finger nucleic acid-binding protein